MSYDYEYPVVTDESETLDELADLFMNGFEDIPFTAAEEEMLPADVEKPIYSRTSFDSHDGFPYPI